MFNKYLIVADHHTNLRDNSQMAELLRTIDLTQSVVRSEGVYDVLDHATATNGYGGKLAIDLTDCASKQRRESELRYSLSDGVEVSVEWVKEWGVLVLFASPDSDIELVEVEGVNFVSVFDLSAKNMRGYDLLWLAAANSDPRRDVVITQEGTMRIDARSKRPGEKGNPARFPNVVTSTMETIELVDRRWDEYGIGEFIESPSRHYRELLLSDREDW